MSVQADIDSLNDMAPRANGSINSARGMLAAGWACVNLCVAVAYICAITYSCRSNHSNSSTSWYGNNAVYGGGGADGAGQNYNQYNNANAYNGQYNSQYSQYSGNNYSNSNSNNNSNSNGYNRHLQYYSNGYNQGGGQQGGMENSWMMYQDADKESLHTGLVFAIVWTGVVAFFTAVFGLLVLGVVTPMGYARCCKGKITNKTRLSIGVFIGSLFMFANMLMVMAALLSDIDDGTKSTNNIQYGEGANDQQQMSWQMGNQNKSLTSRTTEAFSALCLFLAVTYAGFSVIAFLFNEVVLEEMEQEDQEYDLFEEKVLQLQRQSSMRRQSSIASQASRGSTRIGSNISRHSFRKEEPASDDYQLESL